MIEKKYLNFSTISTQTLLKKPIDQLIELKVENLCEQPNMGVKRDGVRGRLLIIPEISMIVSYWSEGDIIRIMRVLHQKQQFPTDLQTQMQS